jgi:Ca2+-binding RTX toxin-like protein
MTGSGANTIISSGTNGSYYGGGGDDVMIAEIGGEFMYGGAGTDLIDLTRFNGVYIVDMGTGSSNYAGETFQGFENLNSGSGDDTITGNSSFNVVNTGAGNDTIIDNDASDDNLDGGAGVDKLISDLTYVDDVLFNFNTGLATFSGGTFLHFSNIENLTVGGGADVIGDGNANVITITDTGFVHTNVVDGGGGNDTINTGIGDDTLIGGAGADTLNGGAGTDTVDYSIASTVVVVHLDTPTQYGQYGSGGGGAIETDTLIAIENVTTGSGADYVYGSAGDNVINTNAGNDAVYAGNGADTINTGAGQDYVEGSYGADTIDAGADNDKVYGGADNDIIYGGDGNDSLYGNHGNDQIYGGNGVDVLFIDSTDTTYDGGAGIDYIVWNDAVVAANLDITAHSADYFYGYTGADIVTAIGALAHTELHGGGGGDTLTGSNGVGSHLLGEDGNDRLISGTGTDYMVGGAGADTFVFGPGGGTDYVYDFKTGGADVIDFTALAGLGIHSLANLIINTAYAASGWFGYSYGSGTAWLNTTAVGSTQPVAADFLFA